MNKAVETLRLLRRLNQASKPVYLQSPGISGGTVAHGLDMADGLGSGYMVRVRLKPYVYFSPYGFNRVGNEGMNVTGVIVPAHKALSLNNARTLEEALSMGVYIEPISKRKRKQLAKKGKIYVL
jgi:hypothetical protein